MSFGVSVGDFVALGAVCWQVYKRCKEASGEFKHVTTEVSSLHSVLKETEELLSEEKLNGEQLGRLQPLQQGILGVLRELEALLKKHESVATPSKRMRDILRWAANTDVQEIRGRLISQTNLLDTFINSTSLARLETKLDQLAAEIRSGKHRGSVVLSQSFDQNDEAAWKQLEKELKNVGIPVDLIKHNKQFIIIWIREAAESGKLGNRRETTPPSRSEGSNSRITDHTRESDSEPESAPSPRATRASRGSNLLWNRNSRKAQAQAAPSLSSTSGTEAAGRPQGRSIIDNKHVPRRRWHLSNLFRSVVSEQDVVDAIQKNDVRRFYSFLKRGVDLNTQGDSEDGGAILTAVKYNKPHFIEPLLDHGFDIEASDWSWSTALCIAAGCERDQSEILEILLSRGADINGNALNDAVAYNNLTHVKLLLAHGAVIEARIGSRSNSLITAARAGHVDIAKLLLANGASVNATDEGDTPLITAAFNQHAAMVKVLIEHGADIRSRDNSGYNALDRAADKCNGDIIKLLVENGADLNETYGDKMSPLDRIRAGRLRMTGDVKYVRQLLYDHAPLTRLLRFARAID